jgi:hypothetical protein
MCPKQYETGVVLNDLLATGMFWRNHTSNPVGSDWRGTAPKAEKFENRLLGPTLIRPAALILF